MIYLVRENKSGRQYKDEMVHLIDKDSENTLCGEYTKDETVFVMNIGCIKGDSPVCPQCSEQINS